MMNVKTIHPFPARMAPDIAFEVIKDLPKNSRLLDPMMGSGTTLQLGIQNNCHCSGADIDPLAILISKTSLTYIEPQKIKEQLPLLIRRLNRTSDSYPRYWDEDTQKFANFWFGDIQLKSLKRLCKAVEGTKEEDLKNLFRIALSRCIITKEKGASLASDVSHAKPHRTKAENDFEVLPSFVRAVSHISKRSIEFRPQKQINLFSDDARNLKTIEQKSIDCIITSPPYLHAVDYFRGHRLSLIWMGYRLKDLSELRANSIGIQKIPESDNVGDLKDLLAGIGHIHSLPEKPKKHLTRYAFDIFAMCNEFNRVLKKNRKVTIVIADAWSAGIAISNTKLIKNAAKLSGLTLVSQTSRNIPANKRYLPPPEYLTNSALDRRMKKEAILAFVKR